jgi:hypothetical protein
MKILIQFDEREREIFGQRKLIMGFDLASTIFEIALESEVKYIQGIPMAAVPKTTLRIEGRVLGEIYKETWAGQDPDHHERLLKS